MKQEEKVAIENRAYISLKLYNECRKRMISGSTMRMITDIIEHTEMMEEEQVFQTIGRITDILQESKTEEEFLEKLHQEYPDRV